MERNRNFLPNSLGTPGSSENWPNVPIRSSLPSLEDQLREIMAKGNGNASNAMVGDNMLAGGPPPAKPFPDPAPATNNDDYQNKISNTSTPKTIMTDKKMSDNVLRDSLAHDCAMEESMIGKNRLSDFKPSKETLQYLLDNDVRPLKKKSQKFPQAIYYCRICDYHCDNLGICISHIRDLRHSRLIKMQTLETTLFHLPKPGRHHIDSLNQLLIKIEKENGLPAKEIQHRTALAARLTRLFQNSIPGCTVRLYGSSLTGFGMIGSGLNLDLLLPDNGTIRPHIALINSYKILLSAGPEFQNVQNDFGAKIPIISFMVSPTNPTGAEYLSNNSRNCIPMHCELSLNNHNAFQTSQLLADYCLIDPRVRSLGVSLRYWAKICKVDRQSEGTLPSHAFPILLVHFLQQEKNPILPCMHDYISLDSETDVYKTPIAEIQRWKTRNVMTIGELWIAFFEYYALGFNMNENVVSIRKIGGYTRQEKQWKGKKLVIEDPFSTKRSLTRSVNSLTILDFISDCFKIGYLYFGTIQTFKGPVITRIVVPDTYNNSPDNILMKESEKCAITGNNDKSIETFFKDITQHGNKELDNPVCHGPSNISINSSQVVNISPKFPAEAITAEEFERSLLIEDGYFPPRDINGSSIAATDDTLDAFLKKHGTELSPKQAQQLEELVPKNMIIFAFDPMLLTGGQSPALICTVCGFEGHLQNACPDEKIPPLHPLPVPLAGNHQLLLDRVCEEVMYDWEPKNSEILQRKMIVESLRNFILRYHSNAILTVFGSSVNGFAFAKSDLDISLTFKNHETASELDAISIIDNVADKMQQMSGIRNIQAITSAKVPIIKFLHHDSRIEGDISLYNILAQENTRMLRCYSLIDVRVRILGYMAKLFAKICDIGDASRGSLSSYAYILMLIHYLQNCVPPVVPVLQELYPGCNPNLYEEDDRKPNKMIDGWNAWFYDDLKNLRQVWPGYGENKQSVGTLWLGFLDYYARCFDDKNEVVCIRQARPLSKFEKMWNNPCIAIEDPFDLNHNLGAGISRKMNLYIKKAFVKTRNHYGFLPHPLPCHYKQYLFDPNALRDGNPPNDRGCRACGKIGHLVRDCPRKKYADERKKRETPRLGDSVTNDSAKKDSVNRHDQQKPTIERKEGSISPDLRVKSIKSQPPQKSQPDSQISTNQGTSNVDGPTDAEELNPLRSMLTNMGIMNIGNQSSNHKLQPSLVDSNESMVPATHFKQLSLQNAVPADELEKHLMESGTNAQNSFSEPRLTTRNHHESSIHGPSDWQRPPGSINPPPGFLPTSHERRPTNSPSSSIMSTPFPQFGIIGLSAPGPSLQAHQMIMPQENRMQRFSQPDVLRNSFLPLGNISNDNLVHSSPFGLGLPIGGLGHMIGRPQGIDASLPRTVGASNPSTVNHPSHIWNNLTGQQQTPGASNGQRLVLGSPDFSEHSHFGNNLFHLPFDCNLRGESNSDNDEAAKVSAPWPPNRD